MNPTPAHPAPLPQTPASSQREVYERLRRDWTEARAGRGRVVHLVGPVGAGKSTLLARLVESVSGPGEQAAVVSARFGDDWAPGSDQALLEALVLRVVEAARALEASGESTQAAEAGVPWLLPGADFLAAATGIAALPTSSPRHRRPSRAAIFADLLLDVAREHPVLLVLDDAQRADPASRALAEELAEKLLDEATGEASREGHRLMLLLCSALPLRDADQTPGWWAPEASATVTLPIREVAWALELVSQRLGRFVHVPEADRRRLAEAARGNPGVLEAMLDRVELALAAAGAERVIGDLLEASDFVGLQAVAVGALPSMAANVRADLQAAAVIGPTFDVALLGQLWGVAPDAAAVRVFALERTGLVASTGGRRRGRLRFLSEEIARYYREALPQADRDRVHARVACLLRARAEEPEREAELVGRGLDVTETWSAPRRRDRQQRERFETLWAATRHFARARRPVQAAEAAVSLAERLFEIGEVTLGRIGRRHAQERRHRIQVALAEAGAQLALAKARPADEREGELVGIDTRLLTVRARFKELLGDLAEARRLASRAVEMAGHVRHPALRLEAMRVQMEVHYAAGDHNGARRCLVRIIEELARRAAGVPRETAVRVWGWLVESIGRWEWPGLHDRLFPHLIDQLKAVGARREALKAMVEQLMAAIDADPLGDPPGAFLEAIVSYGTASEVLPHTAEQLTGHGAELLSAIVDNHFDALSGEHYTPDLFAPGPFGLTLDARLAWPIRLLERAEALARQAGNEVTRLRVLTTILGVLYDTRERFGELLDRWMPPRPEGQRPLRLVELMNLLDEGFFGLANVTAVHRQVVDLAQVLGLHQVLADTFYEALDRELPSAVADADAAFELARRSYERVGDAYGTVTLELVAFRYREDPAEAEAKLAGAIDYYEAHGEPLDDEQRAFVEQRFGELLIERDQIDRALHYLERSIQLYDGLGDVERVHRLAATLRELYRERGDFGRYRSLRERFRAMERHAPWIDPLGLELRIEHLLSRARQEPDDERAIEMVERCVAMFKRLPDSTTRIDECFVEISKICRRRADEAQTEAALHGWLRRSLAAVETAASINRTLGNFHRVFEELHELFDDLLGLGAYDQYLQARADSRELAFALGNVAELTYLFEEHLAHDPGEGFDFARLPEVRALYQALRRYLLGLGAATHAELLADRFVEFLHLIGESELASDYEPSAPREE